MKYVTVLLILCLSLCGCSQSEPVVWESVFDEDTAAVSYMEEAYSICLQVPREAEQLPDDPASGRRIYRHRDEAYELYTQVYLASDFASAVRQLTGCEPEQLNILTTRRFGMPEYRFTWYEPQGQTGRLCRGALFMDNTVCYAVVFSVPEEAGGKYNQLITETFSTIGLFYAEGV